jgi:hypothetical protein
MTASATGLARTTAAADPDGTVRTAAAPTARASRASPAVSTPISVRAHSRIASPPEPPEVAGSREARRSGDSQISRPSGCLPLTWLMAPGAGGTERVRDGCPAGEARRTSATESSPVNRGSRHHPLRWPVLRHSAKLFALMVFA